MPNSIVYYTPDRHFDFHLRRERETLINMIEGRRPRNFQWTTTSWNRYRFFRHSVLCNKTIYLGYCASRDLDAIIIIKHDR